MTGEVVAQTEYLTFRDATPEGRKTKVITVISRRQNNTLGEIHWYGAWRQYCFYPRTDTIWNEGCLAGVVQQIDALMEQRRKDKRP